VGIGVRTFLIDNDDSLQRFSMARLDKLLRSGFRETLPQYAGKRIRCAMVFPGNSEQAAGEHPEHGLFCDSFRC